MINLQFSSQTLSQAVVLATPNRYGVVDISPHTIRWMRSAVVSLRKSTGDMEITAVTPHLVAQWQRSEIERRTKTVTINGYLRALKTLYSRLQRNGITGHNPAQSIRPLPEPQPSPKAISELNYLKLRDAAGSERNIAILDTLWATGCRAGELIGMEMSRLQQWADDPAGAAINVIGKNKRQRFVYWSGVQADSLAAWLAVRPPTHSPAVFLTNKRRPYTASGFSALLRQIRIRANSPRNSNAHAFRHAFAIRKLDAGYDLATVSQWLGHSTPEFTAKVYCIRSEQELRSRYFSPPVSSTDSQMPTKHL